MNWIIKVDNLSKVYRIGTGAMQEGTLFEQVVKRFKQKMGQPVIVEPAIEQPDEKSVVSQGQSEGLSPGHFWALKDVSFEVAPGERIGIIGQNGSGKSTLLKILSRITAPTFGEVRYKGHLISLLEVGTGFHSELSGRDNIYLNAAINGMTRQQINLRLKDILEFSELGKQIDTPVKRYSSGMYMRLAFSVAAYLESEILLIDEVLAVGDANFQAKCKQKMLEVANDGRTVIFVSHDMKSIEAICSKTLEMSHGKLVGTTDLLKEAKKELQLDLQPETVSAKNGLCAEKNWLPDDEDAPKLLDAITLLSCKVVSDDNVAQEKFSVNETLHVVIRFLVKDDKLSCATRITLSTPDGIILFTAMDSTNQGTRMAGLYTETLTIPKEFLNEGLFNITVEFQNQMDEQKVLTLQDCLTIKIIDDYLPLGVRGNWDGAWPVGLLRPKLNWKVEHEQAKSSMENEITSA